MELKRWAASEHRILQYHLCTAKKFRYTCCRKKESEEEKEKPNDDNKKKEKKV